MSRQCARPGCSTAASATLLFDYRARTSSLESLIDEPHPMAYDLCEVHADALTVPRGWHLDDNRDGGTGRDDHVEPPPPPEPVRRRPLPPFESPYVYN
jgi:Protein of unknown function (DUF3499)